MPPSRNLRIQVPGETAALADSGEDGQAMEPVDQRVDDSGGDEPPAPGVADGDDPAKDQVATLQLQLAALQAQLAELTTQRAQPKSDEGVVYEPKTPHGAQALAASEFRSMTTTEVHAKVIAGEISLGGKPSVLCADGYYCDPSYR